MNRVVRSAALLGLAGAVALGAGCRGDREAKRPRQFLPDMDDSPKWKPQTGSEFYADGRNMRVPVAGTVAFGPVAFVSGEEWAAGYMGAREDLLRNDDALYLGMTGTSPDGKPQWTERIPVAIDVSDALIARGQERFNIYCSACHGYAGDGKGMVGQRWAAPVPSFHDPKYRDPNEPDGKNRDGFLFHTALNGVVGPDGVQKMPPYKHALSERDAWAVVAYIRVLQQSHLGTASDIPADQRERLERLRAELIQKAQEEAARTPAGAQGATGGQP